MGKSKHERLPWDARAADVLAGRTKLEAGPLIALVNEVNPTGRDRDPHESAARYALKARLQSLLCARFAQSIEVVADPSQPGVVSLRHRVYRDAACHALVEALDDDARSWVRRTLDLGDEPDEDEAERAAAPRRAEPDSDEDLDDPEAVLAAAARAEEEEFDFDRAGVLYRRAFAERPDARSAHALLRFLVDVMAADAEALALEGDLPPPARSHPGVRILLGLAAARSGDEALGASHVAHLSEPRAAEVLAIVARAALARGDAAAAAARLAEAAKADPAHPDLRPLAEELAKVREAQRAPHEAELARLVAQGRAAEATEKAESILARWPESEPARRAARTLEERRRLEEGERLVADALAARSRNELATALAWLERALAAPLGDETRKAARRAAAEIQGEVRERATSERVDRVLAALSQGRAAGLMAYADLDDDARTRARERATEPALDWLEAMIASGARSTKAAVDAVIALEHARAHPDGAPASLLAGLAPHERMLELVPAAREVLGRAKSKLADDRRSRALADLAAAEEAIASGDAARAELLAARAARDLPEEATERAGRVKAVIGVLGERRELVRRLERANATHHYAAAQRALADLAARTEGEERAAWLDQARAQREGVARALKMQVVEIDAGAELSRGNHVDVYPPHVVPCVDLDAGTVILPNAAARTLVLRSYALDTGRLVRWVEAATPEEFYEPGAAISGASVLCAGGGNGVLEFSRATGEPLRWTLLRDSNRMDRRVMAVLVPVPGGRYMWIHHDEDGPQGGVHDLEGERPYRDVPGTDSFHALPGLEPARVAAVRNESVLSLHEPGGNQTARYDFPSRVRGVARHPAGEGLVVAFDRVQKYPDPAELVWAEITKGGEHGATGELGDDQQYVGLSMASAADLGMVFISYRMREGQDRLLVALALVDGKLREVYRVPFGERRFLVQDPEGRRVFAVAEHEGGVEVTPLDRAAPVLRDLGPRAVFVLPLERLWSCTQPLGLDGLGIFVKWFKWRPVAEIRRHALELRASHEGDLRELLRVFWGLTVSDDEASAGDLAAWLHERYPDDADVQQATWAALVVARKWSALAEVLEPLDDAAYPAEHRQHRRHLLATAHIALGNVALAKDHLEHAREIPGRCQLEPIQTLARALLPEDDASRDLAHGQLLSGIQVADGCLGRGDHAGVIEVFERGLTFEVREAQSLARLAVAHLARPTATPAERLRKRFALATFVDALAEARAGFRCELLVPGATWTKERLDALAAEASAWLDA